MNTHYNDDGNADAHDDDDGNVLYTTQIMINTMINTSQLQVIWSGLLYPTTTNKQTRNALMEEKYAVP